LAGRPLWRKVTDSFGHAALSRALKFGAELPPLNSGA
jgi:hypothetical protein